VSRRRTLLELISHFWLRVDLTGDCWLWTGEVNNKGYGVYCIWEGAGRERLLAHRFSALMAGMPVHSPRDVVMHTCDTPRCVRPAHLSVGTQLDNMRDARAKGRINVEGLFASIPQRCKGCDAPFMAKPGQYYCSKEHRPKPQRIRVGSHK
jgi:hypothetical protein